MPERRILVRSRSERRRHEQRLKRRVRAYYGEVAVDNPRHLGRIAHARQLCSCSMCGNPRRRLGEKTIVEQATAESEREWRASCESSVVHTFRIATLPVFANMGLRGQTVLSGIHSYQLTDARTPPSSGDR